MLHAARNWWWLDDPLELERFGAAYRVRR